MPTILPEIERVLSAKLLGVRLQSDLGMGIYVDNITKICKQRLYLLTQFKTPRSVSKLLKIVSEAIVISRIIYAAPGWRGYASRADIDFIQKLFVKARRWGIVNTDYNLEELPYNCDRALFVASQSSKHCLYRRFPKKDTQLHTIVLRRRGHNCALTIIIIYNKMCW